MAEPKEQNANKILNDAAKCKWGSSEYWIGIKGINNGTSWTWASDGSTVAWMNWMYSEPSARKTPMCVWMYAGYEQRRYAYCAYDRRRYICEL